MNEPLIQLDLESISPEVQRERLLHRGHMAGIHLWWGRRPLIAARAASYAGLLSTRNLDRHFLEALCTFQPTSQVIAIARKQILQDYVDTLSQEQGKEITIAQVEAGEIPHPKVLDMFAGGGSIPLEAMRLGVRTYALDLSPVAYLILLCTIRYPQLYGKTSEEKDRKAEGYTWSGLDLEVMKWSRWVQDRVVADTSNLYPELAAPETGSGMPQLLPSGYIWSRTVVCPNAACGGEVPLSDHIPLRQKHRQYTAFVPAYDKSTRKVNWQLVDGTRPPVREAQLGIDLRRGWAVCPYCDQKFPLDSFLYLDVRHTLVGTIAQDTKHQRIYIPMHTENDFRMPAEQNLREMLADVAHKSGIALPEEPLPLSRRFYPMRYGFSRYQDLFTARQLLLLFSYVRYTRAAHDAMLKEGMTVEHAKVTASYLGLLTSMIARRHNNTCRWQAQMEIIQPALGRPPGAFSGHFVEITPFFKPLDFVSDATQLSTSIQEQMAIGDPAEVLCGSATDLPYDDATFDAIVTDPPYYDAIAYADLADFYYVWLKRCIGHLYPDHFAGDLSPKQNEIVVAEHRNGPRTEALKHRNGPRTEALKVYDQLTEQALREAHRVLRPNRSLTVMFSSTSSFGLQRYINMIQDLGFELLRVVRGPNTETQKPTTDGAADRGRPGPNHILSFRKIPLTDNILPATINADKVLELASSDRPNLYSGLVELIREKLEDQDIEAELPANYSGSLHDRLVEHIASSPDLEHFLDMTLGRATLRAIVREKGWAPNVEDSSESSSSIILRGVGFDVPSRLPHGVVASISELRALTARVQIAKSAVELCGYLVKGMTLVESTLWRSSQVWARAIFGAGYQEHLLKLLQNRVQNLDRLSMGSKLEIFCRLPDYIAESPDFKLHALDSFGREHIYKPRKQTEKLDQLTAIRNKVAHNENNYCEEFRIEVLRAEFKVKLELAAAVLNELMEAGAILLIVQPKREIRDAYARRIIELHIEDNTVREICTTHPLSLGKNYFYVGAKNNPRPLNPVMVPVSDIA